MRQRIMSGVFLIVLSMVLTGSVVAKEIALVTQVEGDVSAEHSGKTWSILLGESLPVGAKVSVGDGATLSIIHLALNKEITIPSGGQAEITDDDVVSSGEKFKGAALEGLPAALSLEMASQQQMGAIDPQRLTTGVDKGASDENFEPGEDDRTEIEAPVKGSENRDQTAKLAGPPPGGRPAEVGNDGAIQPSSPQSSPARQGAGLETGTPSPAPSLPKLNDRIDERKRQEGSGGGNRSGVAGSSNLAGASETVPLGLALPRALFANLPKEGQDFVVEKAASEVIGKLTGREDPTGWVVFSGEVQPISGSICLLSAPSGKRVLVTVLGDGSAPDPSVLEAFKLEARGFLGQAASIWLKLRTGSVSQAVADQHLRRLAKRIRKTQ